MHTCALADVSATIAALPDRALLVEVERLATDEQQTTSRLIAALAELDQRRVYRDAGCSSLFTYCTQVLHLSEHAAYRRIEAARASRRFPRILERLAAGAITLTAVGLLAPHLTDQNHEALLDQARHRCKRDLEGLVARLRPQPDVPALIRRVPAPRVSVAPSPLAQAADAPAPASPHCGTSTAGAAIARPPAWLIDVPAGNGGGTASRAGMSASPAALVTPLAPERYRLQGTMGAETHAKLRRAQDLLRHVVPDGDLAAIVDRALTVLIANLEKTRIAATPRPRAARTPSPTSRHIPAAVTRAVWARDDGRCTFVGTHGRCAERGFLQRHHRVPYAVGGQATAENIELRCTAHNALAAERDFGVPAWADRFELDPAGINDARRPPRARP